MCVCVCLSVCAVYELLIDKLVAHFFPFFFDSFLSFFFEVSFPSFRSGSPPGDPIKRLLVTHGRTHILSRIILSIKPCLSGTEPLSLAPSTAVRHTSAASSFFFFFFFLSFFLSLFVTSGDFTSAHNMRVYTVFYAHKKGIEPQEWSKKRRKKKKKLLCIDMKRGIQKSLANERKKRK